MFVFMSKVRKTNGIIIFLNHCHWQWWLFSYFLTARHCCMKRKHCTPPPSHFTHLCCGLNLFHIEKHVTRISPYLMQPLKKTNKTDNLKWGIGMEVEGSECVNLWNRINVLPADSQNLISNPVTSSSLRCAVFFLFFLHILQ